MEELGVKSRTHQHRPGPGGDGAARGGHGPPGEAGVLAAGNFFLAALAVTFQLFLLARFVEQDMATVEDTANARFLAAMVLLVCTEALNLAAFLLARRRAHK